MFSKIRIIINAISNIGIVNKIVLGIVESFVVKTTSNFIDTPKTIGKIIAHLFISLGIFFAYQSMDTKQPEILSIKHEVGRKNAIYQMGELTKECKNDTYSSWIRVEKTANNMTNATFITFVGCASKWCKNIIDFSIQNECYNKIYHVDGSTQLYLSQQTNHKSSLLESDRIIKDKLYSLADMMECAGMGSHDYYMVVVKQSDDIIWIFGLHKLSTTQCDKASFELEKIAKTASELL